MKFLFISENASSLGVALRVKAEGNKVVYWIRDLKSVDAGRGLITKAYEFDRYTDIDKDTIIISDCVGDGLWLDMLQSSGYAVVGGSKLADRLEMDRIYTYDIFKECGIPVAEYEEYNDFESAKQTVESTSDDVRLVFKPSGESSGIVPSHVAKNKQDMLEFLDTAPGLMSGGHTFILQEFIEGVDLSTEGWFTGERFLRPFNHTIESKKFGAGDLGPTVGCAGNIIWGCEDEYCEQTVGKVEQWLSGKGYIGPIDINVIVTSEKRVYGLEFTPRFGNDAAGTLFTCLLKKGDVGQFFSDLALGQTNEMPISEDFAAGIRMSIFPYPSHHEDIPTGVSINNLGNPPFDNFHAYGIMKNEDKIVICSGSIGVACGTGEDISSAMNLALQRADEIEYNDKQYRKDLGEVFEEVYQKL